MRIVIAIDYIDDGNDFEVKYFKETFTESELKEAVNEALKLRKEIRII